MQKPSYISFIISLSLVQADNVTIGISRVREVSNLRSQSGVISDQPTRHETGLVRVYFSNGPRTNPSINKVSVHLAVCVHRRNRAVIGNKSRVTLLKEEAEIGQLETTM